MIKPCVPSQALQVVGTKELEAPVELDPLTLKRSTSVFGFTGEYTYNLREYFLLVFGF
jgi:hypothetical protein